MRPADIATLLPAVISRTSDGSAGDVLLGLLEAMDVMHRPCEDVLGRLPALFTPRLTEDRMVGFLAGWADLDRVVSTGSDDLWTLPSGLGHLRELVATSIDGSRRRGIKAGLIAFLETATGVPGFEVLDGRDGVERPFHLVVRLPGAAEPYRQLVAQLVEAEKPVHLTAELDPPAAPVGPPPSPQGP